MKLISWNVNGLRACIQKGFKDFFNEFDDDSIEMMCLSVEWGCNVFAMNIYRNKKWEEPQYFNV